MQSYANLAATSVPPAREIMGCPYLQWCTFKLPHTTKFCLYSTCAQLLARGVTHCLQGPLRAGCAQRNSWAFLHRKQVALVLLLVQSTALLGKKLYRHTAVTSKHV